jgi:hypothetical protein
VLHTDVDEIREYISEFYNIIKEEYFLGIRGKEVFESGDEKYAALYAVVGKRTEKR